MITLFSLLLIFPWRNCSYIARS